MKELLLFLDQLAENNQKEWMDANREWYLKVRSSFLGTVSDLLAHLAEIEPGLTTLAPKDCVFRPNRDIRFSANKQPYKTNMAAYFAVGGKKSEMPGYYLHVEPGKSFLAGGAYTPSADMMKKIRQEIDYSGGELNEIVHKKEFKEIFGEIGGDRLKTTPRGYPQDHPFIHYLRLKSFVVNREISDQELINGTYLKKVQESFSLIKPFNDFFSRAIETVEDGDGLL